MLGLLTLIAPFAGVGLGLLGLRIYMGWDAWAVKELIATRLIGGIPVGKPVPVSIVARILGGLLMVLGILLLIIGAVLA